MTSAKTLSADDLLHGAMYAIEQAGHLVHDAVELYERGRYSSAMVLAVFAREEMGRAEIFLAKRKRALTPAYVSVSSVKQACKDHIEKLRRGQTAIVTRWGPQHREILKPLFGGDPQSEAWKKARGFVDQYVKAKARRDPNDTHQKRQRALYVEPSATGSGWNRPCETGKEEARQLLEDIGSDYGQHLDRLETQDDERLSAIAHWKERPEFPPPIWPSGP